MDTMDAFTTAGDEGVGVGVGAGRGHPSRRSGTCAMYGTIVCWLETSRVCVRSPNSSLPRLPFLSFSPSISLRNPPSFTSTSSLCSCSLVSASLAPELPSVGVYNHPHRPFLLCLPPRSGTGWHQFLCLDPSTPSPGRQNPLTTATTSCLAHFDLALSLFPLPVCVHLSVLSDPHSPDDSLCNGWFRDSLYRGHETTLTMKLWTTLLLALAVGAVTVSASPQGQNGFRGGRRQGGRFGGGGGRGGGFEGSTSVRPSPPVK